jgi:hypothetical protein
MTLSQEVGVGKDYLKDVIGWELVPTYMISRNHIKFLTNIKLINKFQFVENIFGSNQKPLMSFQIVPPQFPTI